MLLGFMSSGKSPEKVFQYTVIQSVQISHFSVRLTLCYCMTKAEESIFIKILAVPGIEPQSHKRRDIIMF